MRMKWWQLRTSAPIVDRMKRIALLLLSGCSLYLGDSQDDTAQVTEPMTCGRNVSLAPDVITMSWQLYDAVDANGIDLCIHLDATKLDVAQLHVTTPWFPGTQSDVLVQLEDTQFTPIATAAEFTTTTSDGAILTMAELNWNPSAKIQDVVLWTRARGPAVTPGLDVTFQDPTE
jgi:hypothetical protein